eukprot:3284564-Prymnesium_polylepis.1
MNGAVPFCTPALRRSMPHRRSLPVQTSRSSVDFQRHGLTWRAPLMRRLLVFRQYLEVERLGFRTATRKPWQIEIL